MKKILFLPALIIALAGCTQSNNPKTNEFKRNVQVETADTLCFNRFSGLENQDTSFVKIIINGDKVLGNFSNIPNEKDARIGTITGVKSGSIIKGMWHYKQEGMNDSIAYEFKLQDNILLQKKTSYDVSTGREMLSDTAAFSVEFSQVDCQSAD